MVLLELLEEVGDVVVLVYNGKIPTAVLISTHFASDGSFVELLFAHIKLFSPLFGASYGLQIFRTVALALYLHGLDIAHAVPVPFVTCAFEYVNAVKSVGEAHLLHSESYVHAVLPVSAFSFLQVCGQIYLCCDRGRFSGSHLQLPDGAAARVQPDKHPVPLLSV